MIKINIIKMINPPIKVRIICLARDISFLGSLFFTKCNTSPMKRANSKEISRIKLINDAMSDAMNETIVSMKRSY